MVYGDSSLAGHRESSAGTFCGLSTHNTCKEAMALSHIRVEEAEDTWLAQSLTASKCWEAVRNLTCLLSELGFLTTRRGTGLSVDSTFGFEAN